MASGKILSQRGVSSYTPSFDGLLYQNLSFVRCGSMIQVVGNGIYTNMEAEAWGSITIGTITDSKFLPKDYTPINVSNEGKDFVFSISPDGSVKVHDRSGVGLTNPRYVGNFTATYIAKNR